MELRALQESFEAGSGQTQHQFAEGHGCLLHGCAILYANLLVTEGCSPQDCRCRRRSAIASMTLPKLKILGKIVDSGLVAVVRAESSEQASRIADACAQGGVGAIEITFTVPGAQ